ncbi:MAG: 30S ribosomal protein S4 [Candidatus Aenigmarchaeota archaeon]|nr:30S ribosomal protein S4 [Candidatus Aenigmarchaeota archaeon]
MKYIKKKFTTPLRPWDRQRLDVERLVLVEYGLRNKKELWKTDETLKKYRRLAREFIAKPNAQKNKVVVERLVRMGVLEEGASIDDILALKTQKFLERRLQTIVKAKGIANSIKEARQLIVHGKIKVGDRRVVYPSYMVPRDEEDQISLFNRVKIRVEKNAEDNQTEA